MIISEIFVHDFVSLEERQNKREVAKTVLWEFCALYLRIKFTCGNKAFFSVWKREVLKSVG